MPGLEDRLIDKPHSHFCDFRLGPTVIKSLPTSNRVTLWKWNAIEKYHMSWGMSNGFFVSQVTYSVVGLKIVLCEPSTGESNYGGFQIELTLDRTLSRRWQR